MLDKEPKPGEVYRTSAGNIALILNEQNTTKSARFEGVIDLDGELRSVLWRHDGLAKDYADHNLERVAKLHELKVTFYWLYRLRIDAERERKRQRKCRQDNAERQQLESESNG